MEILKCSYAGYCPKRSQCAEGIGYAKEHCELYEDIYYAEVTDRPPCEHWIGSIVIMEKPKERRQT